jgi:hypothetical protein
VSDFDQIDALITEAEQRKQEIISARQWRKEESSFLYESLLAISEPLKEKLKKINADVVINPPSESYYDQRVESSIEIRIPSMIITGKEDSGTSYYSGNVRVEAVRESKEYKIDAFINMSVSISGPPKTVSKDQLKEAVISHLNLTITNMMNSNKNDSADDR